MCACVCVSVCLCVYACVCVSVTAPTSTSASCVSLNFWVWTSFLFHLLLLLLLLSIYSPLHHTPSCPVYHPLLHSYSYGRAQPSWNDNKKPSITTTKTSGWRGRRCCNRNAIAPKFLLFFVVLFCFACCVCTHSSSSSSRTSLLWQSVARKYGTRAVCLNLKVSLESMQQFLPVPLTTLSSTRLSTSSMLSLSLCLSSAVCLPACAFIFCQHFFQVLKPFTCVCVCDAMQWTMLNVGKKKQNKPKDRRSTSVRNRPPPCLKWVTF